MKEGIVMEYDTGMDPGVAIVESVSDDEETALIELVSAGGVTLRAGVEDLTELTVAPAELNARYVDRVDDRRPDLEGDVLDVLQRDGIETVGDLAGTTAQHLRDLGIPDTEDDPAATEIVRNARYILEQVG